MKILVIQTASIGDVILATALLEKLHGFYPSADLDFLVKKGNEQLFESHPYLHELLVWDKKNGKRKNLRKIVSQVRASRYDIIVNVQRFFSTGKIVAFSRAKQSFGFRKNPLSVFYTKSFPHSIGTKGNVYLHETERNQQLIAGITDSEPAPMRLYPTDGHYLKVARYKQEKYICVAPASLWFTKQFPKHRWIEFLRQVPDGMQVYLLGGKGDVRLCDGIIESCPGKKIMSLAGELSLLESAAIMRDAAMNYVCDSSPMHLASSVDAPTTAVFCSTVPEFGFGPKSSDSVVVQENLDLDCRPCGLHGHKNCPKGNFLCAENIMIQDLLSRLPE